MANLTSFIPGDIVVSISGDGAPGDTTTYTDNQGSPITLEEINPTTGAIDGTLVLPQATTTNGAGVTESVISGEYGSSSEGSLQLSADGHSLTIAGYGINAATYNAAEASGGSNAYGNAALAQTTSVTGGTSTAVTRVFADIGATGTVDTSTALYNVYNTQNPRSVVTANGTTFYTSGQSVKGSATQGVLETADGSTTYSPIYTTVDTRTAELYNGTLYVSSDSSQAKGTGNISSFGQSPTGTTAPTALPGITGTVTLTAAQTNGINSTGTTVDISPENFFFANANTLYVADSGNPKGGGLGDGGLQKWTLGANGTWSLQYTLSSGLNLVADNTADPGQGKNATTGLIGLTGKVTGNTVQLYATNATIGDLNSTYVYGISDTLNATTPAANEMFTQIAAAPNADSNIRGIAFAPTVVCFAGGTRIRTPGGDVAVEDLRIGDAVVTITGDPRPIVWLGHRKIDCRASPRPDEVLPVRIAAHAFGDNRPARDLRVSPGHSLCIDAVGEVLIPASALVNGSTIRQEEVATITYWHVELASHDVILADNLPCESYLEMGNRSFFAGATTVLHASPDAPAITHADFCRPFHADGSVVAFVRDRLAARALELNWTRVENPLADLHLVVDGRRVEPEVRDLSARFLVPAAAKTVELVSTVVVPALQGGGADSRPLGVCVGRLVIDDGFAPQQVVAADDHRLCAGFHHVEPGPQRWTAGRARLPMALWEGCRGAFFLRVDLALASLPRWVEPAGDVSDRAPDALAG